MYAKNETVKTAMNFGIYRTIYHDGSDLLLFGKRQ